MLFFSYRLCARATGLYYYEATVKEIILKGTVLYLPISAGFKLYCTNMNETRRKILIIHVLASTCNLLHIDHCCFLNGILNYLADLNLKTLPIALGYNI